MTDDKITFTNGSSYTASDTTTPVGRTDKLLTALDDPPDVETPSLFEFYTMMNNIKKLEDEK